MRFFLMLCCTTLMFNCGLFGRPTFTCPVNTHPCGTGCIPTGAVCCDDGSGKTSAYCTNGAAGCFENARDCQAVFPAGQKAEFCCGDTGSFGSNDCPSGQRHCGLLCQADNKPCCPAGAKDGECPEMSWDEAGCTSAKGAVGCGVCLSNKSCISCPTGSCCQAGIVCGGSGAICVTGPACVGTVASGGTGGGGGSNSCPSSANPCGTSGGIQTVEVYWPKGCACPTGTQDLGGSKLNALCGLPGSGTNCHTCSCQ